MTYLQQRKKGVVYSWIKKTIWSVKKTYTLMCHYLCNWIVKLNTVLVKYPKNSSNSRSRILLLLRIPCFLLLMSHNKIMSQVNGKIYIFWKENTSFIQKSWMFPTKNIDVTHKKWNKIMEQKTSIFKSSDVFVTALTTRITVFSFGTPRLFSYVNLGIYDCSIAFSITIRTTFVYCFNIAIFPFIRKNLQCIYS